MNFRNVLVGLIASAVLAGIAVSCGGGSGGYDNTPAAPAAVASGTGRGALVVDATTRDITGGLSFKGLSGTLTSAGIYQAAAGQNAATPIINLTVDRVNAVVPAGTPALTVDQFNALQAGNLYFLIKTSTFPNGEIRGQITGMTNLVAGLAPSIDAAQEGGTVVSSGTGRGVFVVDSSTRLIMAGLMTYANLNNPNNLLNPATAAHIHSSAQNNGVRVNFLPPLATLATPSDPDTAISSTDLTDFNNGNLYFNVHTGSYPGGEIRGAIVLTTTQQQVVRSATLDTTQVVP